MVQRTLGSDQVVRGALAIADGQRDLVELALAVRELGLPPGRLERCFLVGVAQLGLRGGGRGMEWGVRNRPLRGKEVKD